MTGAEKMKFKFLQRNYKPKKKKEAFSFAKGFFDEIEDFLTPESEKKKAKEKAKKDGAEK